MALWGLIFHLRGENAHMVWQGDGEAPGLVADMICASIVGCVTTALLRNQCEAHRSTDLVIKVEQANPLIEAIFPE
jgi:hypothetical protein